MIFGEGEQQGQKKNTNLYTQLRDWCATEQIRLVLVSNGTSLFPVKLSTN